jgi:hypothetical protein
MLSASCTSWSTFDQCPDQFDASTHDFAFAVFGEPAAACGETIFRAGFDDASNGCAASVRD